jgi:hypothetical protein
MPRRNGEAAIAPFAHRLGSEPDHVIAREAGVSRAFIVNYRKRAGIRPYEGYKFGSGSEAAQGAEQAPQRRRRADTRAPASAPVTSRSRRRDAVTAPEAHVGSAPAPQVVFRVVVEASETLHEYAVMAPTLLDAVSLAERALRVRHPSARLRSVERVAALLTATAQ